MTQRPLLDDEVAQAAAPMSLFGAARPEELRRLGRADWRSDVVKALLFIVEGVWLLAWTFFLIEWSNPAPFVGAVPLVLGWLLLSGVSLGMGMAHIRAPGEDAREGVQRLLILLMIVLTPLWWAAASGGFRPFLRDIGALTTLHPGPGFWTLWLGILTWARGLDWSQQGVGLVRARATLHAGLVVLGLLALLGVPARLGLPLVPLIGLLWLVGLLALGIARLVQEDRALFLSRPSRVTLKQAALVAATALGTMGVGALVLWLLAPERRAAISQWVLTNSEGPARWLLLRFLGATVWLLTLVYNGFAWVINQLKERFGIIFTVPPQPAAPEEGSVDAFFQWLMTLIPPNIAFVLRLGLFLAFLGLVLFLIITRLNRVRYGDTVPDAEEEAEERHSALRDLLANLGTMRLPLRRRAPEPEDRVRRLYVRLVRMGETRGASWRERRTPYEHERLLRRALPGHDADIHLITEQYIRVRYAAERLPATDLQAVEAAFDRLHKAFSP